MIFFFSFIIFLSLIIQLILAYFFFIFIIYILLRQTIYKDNSKVNPATLKLEKKIFNIDKWFSSLKVWQHIILFIFTGVFWIATFIYTKVRENENRINNYHKPKILFQNRKYKRFKLYFGKPKIPKYKNIKKIKKANNPKLYYDFKKRIDKYTIRYIDTLSGLEFEKYISKLLPKLGYTNVKLTPASNDYGIDVIAEKDSVKFAIQCKHYSNKVNNTSIQETFAGKNYYNCHVGIVVTNNYFTHNAKELAKSNGIILWDRDKLISMINELKK